MNTTGFNSKNQINFLMRDGENFNRRQEGRTFKCIECGGFGYYQAGCPTFFRK